MRQHSVVLVVGMGLLVLVGACSAAQTTAPPAASRPTTVVTMSPPVSPTVRPPMTSRPREMMPGRTPGPPVGCRTGWATGPAAAAGSTRDALYAVRVGEHPCFDRVVFAVNGPDPAGYAVRYVPVVTSDPRGDPLPVAGGAVLQVVIRAPAQGYADSGSQPGRTLARTGDYLYSASRLAHWPVLRAVRFAGFFEGQSTFAVGVRSRLPFRVFTLLDQRDQVREVVVDVARG